MDDPRYDLPPLGGALDELPDFLKAKSGPSPGTVIARLFELEAQSERLSSRCSSLSFQLAEMAERVERLERIVGVMK